MSRSNTTQHSSTNDDFYVVYIKLYEERETEIKIEANVKRRGGIFYFVKINTS